MKSIREIIVEACARINLVPRRQAVPGDILENAFRLLKGIVAKYNNDNLLSWTQNSVLVESNDKIHIYDDIDSLANGKLFFGDTAERNAYPLTLEEAEEGITCYVQSNDTCYKATTRYVDDEPSTPYWTPVISDSKITQDLREYVKMSHIMVPNVAKINSLYVVTPKNTEYRELYKLDFIPFSDFDRYSRNSNVFTYVQKTENEWVIHLKKKFNGRIKINYNEGIEFDIDSDLYIPDAYIELLIVALSHKLALQYPRLDEAQMNRLQQEVSVLVDNVRTPKASDRVLLRDDYTSFFTPNMLMRGI